jgi:pyoverdine/dityrosine biosynthesis protein Dit1
MTMAEQKATQLARDILEFVFRHRRLAASGETCADKPCAMCFAPHLARVKLAIAQGEPVRFVILAFPAKSPNEQKVIGSLPDLAERLALESLHIFCEQLTHYYQPGGRVIVCSDGHVFGSLVGVCDEDISAYRRELELIQASSGCDRIEFFSLEDAFGGIGFDRMREELIDCYSEPVSALREKVIIDPEAKRIFSGIHPSCSKTQPHCSPTSAAIACDSSARTGPTNLSGAVTRGAVWSPRHSRMPFGCQFILSPAIRKRSVST